MTKPRMADSDDVRTITFTEAGKMAGVSHTTVSKWVAMELIPVVQMPGSNRRKIMRKTFLAFVASLETESSATSATFEEET